MFENLFSKEKSNIKVVGGMFDGLFANRKQKIDKEKKQPQSVWRNVPTATDWRKTLPMSIAKPQETPKQNLLQSAVSGITNLGGRTTDLIVNRGKEIAEDIKNFDLKKDWEETRRKNLLVIKADRGGKLTDQEKKEVAEIKKERAELAIIAAIGATEPLKGVGKIIKPKAMAVKAGKEAVAAPEQAKQAIQKPSKMVPLEQEARKYKTAEEFVKNLEKQNKIFYHGTPYKFDKFDMKFVGQRGRHEGRGFYFTDNRNIAKELYTSISGKEKIPGQGTVIEAYLDIKKPMSFNQRKITDYQLKQIVKEAAKINDGLITSCGDNVDDVVKLFREYKTDIDIISGLGNVGTEPQKLNNIVTKITGYDGIIRKEKDGKIIVAFNPDQIKTKSQLTDIWNQANKKTAGAGKLPEVPNVAQPSRAVKLGANLDQVGIKNQTITKTQNIGKLPELPRKNSSKINPKLTGQPAQLLSDTPIGQKLPQSLKEKYTEKVNKSMTKVVEYVQNTDERVRQLVARKDVKVSDISDPYLKMTLYPGRVASKIDVAKAEAETIIKELTQAKISRKEISDYLIARHAPERNLALGKKAAGITTAEANASLKSFEASPKGDVIKKLSDRVQKLNNQTLDLLKESGVISDDLYTNLRTKYKNHIPLNRIMENTDDIGGALSARGYAVRSTGIKRAVGSELEVNDILGNVIANYEQAVIRSEKNIVDQATLAFARDNKDILGDLMEVIKPRAIGKSFDGKMLMKKTNDPTILQLYENGKPIWIKIKDPNLAIALQGVGREKLGGLLNAVAKYTRVFSMLATRFNPEFAFPNKIRDLQETMIYLSAQGKIGIKGVAKMNLRDSASVIDVINYLKGGNSKGAKLYQEMKDLGGTTGGFGLSTRSKVELNLNKMEALANSKTKRLANNIIEYVDNWNTIFEDSTRLSVYKTAIEKGLSKDRAAAMAKEASINFNRMGKGGPVINALYMFSNASIQGTAKMIKSLKNPKVLGATVLAIGGSVATISKFNDKSDKDWRDKVSKWDRLNGLPVVIPSTDNNFRYITIPVSWGVKPIKVMADYAYDALSGIEVDAVEAIKKITTAMLDAYNPVGGTDLTSAITPTILDLPVEIKSNKQWSGSSIRPTLYDKNTPADIQYFSSLKETETGKTAISLTEVLQQKTGIAISPADVKYAFDQLVGGTGRTVSKTVNTISGLISGKGIPADEYPMLSRFYRERTAEEIGYGAGGETEEIKKILGEQSRERFELKVKAENLFDTIKAEPDQAKKKQMLLDVAKENPQIIEKMIDIAKDKELNLNYTQRMIKQLGVENGERATYIASKIKEMETKEEKREYVKTLIEKKILTEEVAEQILPLLAE